MPERLSGLETATITVRQTRGSGTECDVIPVQRRRRAFQRVVLFFLELYLADVCLNGGDNEVSIAIANNQTGVEE